MPGIMPCRRPACRERAGGGIGEKSGAGAKILRHLQATPAAYEEDARSAPGKSKADAFAESRSARIAALPAGHIVAVGTMPCRRQLPSE
jgi:hypothetical protein